MLWRDSVAEFRRGLHLFVRMYVLRPMRRRGAARQMPQLRRAVAAPPGAPWSHVAEAPRIRQSDCPQGRVHCDRSV